MNTINLALVDDDILVLELLSDFLKKYKEYNVIIKANNGRQFLEKLNISKLKPDILLLDLNMKEMDGIELAELLKREYPMIRIIVISSHYKASFIGFMMKTGVAAFLPKGLSPTELLGIIQEVHNKGYYFREQQFDTIREQLSSKSPKPQFNKNNMLSEREKEILRLICQQKTAKEIGEELFITQRTVEGHKNNLFAKSGAKNMAGLVIFAIQYEIININDLPTY